MDYMLNFIDFWMFLFIYFVVVDSSAILMGQFRFFGALFYIHYVAIWKYHYSCFESSLGFPHLIQAHGRHMKWGYMHLIFSWFSICFSLFFFTLLVFALFICIPSYESPIGLCEVWDGVYVIVECWCEVPFWVGWVKPVDFWAFWVNAQGWMDT